MTLLAKAQMLDLEKNDANRLALLDQLLVEGGAIVPVQADDDDARPSIFLMHENGKQLAMGLTLRDAADNLSNSLNEEASQPKPAKRAKKAVRNGEE